MIKKLIMVLFVNLMLQTLTFAQTNQDSIKEKTLDVTKIVTKRKTETSVDFVLKTRQLSPSLMDVLSYEDISRKNIKTVSDALKSIPGVTIMEGKFANIRGMYDRYNANYLNNCLLPSTESDRKAFDFEIIPSNILDNILIIKSATPDVIGDFGGGIIQINTKSVPTKLTQTISLGVQYNSITTFNNIEMFPISGKEWLGILPKNKQIPELNDVLIRNPDFNAQESKKFNNDWTLVNTKALPAPRFSYVISALLKIKQKSIGLIGALNYSTSNRYSDGIVNRNDLSDNRLISNFKDKIYSQITQNGGILNLSFKPNKQLKIDWKNLFNITYENSSTIRTGLSDADNQVYSEGYSNIININKLYTTQINGGNNKKTLNWSLGYGYNKKQTPDYKIAQYSIQEGTRFLVLNDFFRNGTGRFFSTLKENTFNASIDYSILLKQTKIKTGLLTQYRGRKFNSREFIYGPITTIIESNNLPSTDLKIDKNYLYLIEKTSYDIDEYNGISQLNCIYLMAENTYPIFNYEGKPQYLKIIWGVRYEQFNQKLTNDYFTKLNLNISDLGIQNNFLPSINIVIPTTYKSNIRVSLTSTVNRPEMRELAPFSYYSFNMNSEFVGFNKLKTATIKNSDIRYEIYGKNQSMISIGGFYKQITNPIEFALDVTQPAIRTFYYSNAQQAQVVGCELEVRKTYKNLTLYSNLTLVESKVKTIGMDNLEYVRQLQGQSPYIINVSLFYEYVKHKVSTSLNFNKLGSRIAYVGVPKSVQPFGGNILEYGRSLLDFQISKKINTNNIIKIVLGDILSQKSILYQDLNENKKYDKNIDNNLFTNTFGKTLSITYNKTF